MTACEICVSRCVSSIKSPVWFALYREIIRLKFCMLKLFYIRAFPAFFDSCPFETFLSITSVARAAFSWR